MSVLRKLVSGGVVAAMLATTATPAFARGGPYFGGGIGVSSGWGGGYGGHGWRGHRRHRDRVDTGDVIAGIAILGVFAAIASSASKAKRDRADYPRDDYPNSRPSSSDDKRTSSRSDGSIRSEDAAVDACAVEAEQRAGEAASVRDITSVATVSDGWDVNGVIEDRNDWRDKSGAKKRFSCSVRGGYVDFVRIDDGAVALN